MKGKRMKKYLLNWEYTDESGIGMGLEFGSVSGEFNTLREGKDCLRKLTRLTGGKLIYRLWIQSKALAITSGTENIGLKPLAFYDWMLKTQAGCRAPGAHLADLMKKDKTFTKNNTKEGILQYLHIETPAGIRWKCSKSAGLPTGDQKAFNPEFPEIYHYDTNKVLKTKG